MNARHRPFPLLPAAALIAGAALAAAPAAAQPGINPAAVLAAKSAPRGGKGFSDRIARIGSIMGEAVDRAARLRIEKRPDWTRPRYREADALAGAGTR